MANQITPFPPSRAQPSSAPSQGAVPPHTRPQPSVKPQTPLAPQPRQDATRQTGGGFADILDEALGHARLPHPLGLISALEAAREHAGRADQAVPGLGRLVSAVIDDETRKLARYLDLGRS